MLLTRSSAEIDPQPRRTVAKSTGPFAYCTGRGGELPMRDLFEAGRLLLLDMASTIFFLVVFLLTKNLPLSVALGMALGFAQIGWQWTRKKPIDVMQWMSLVPVMGSGAATLISHDPPFWIVKPSLIYIV